MVTTRAIIGPVRTIEADDLATELVRTRYGWLQGRPALSEFILAENQHFGLEREFQLAAERITLVGGKE